MSRVLIWTPNYAPESLGIPPLVTDAAEGLVSAGHVVDVVTPVPYYPSRLIAEPYRRKLWVEEEAKGVVLHRHWLRVRPHETFLDKALYEVTCSAMGLPAALRLARRADVLVCVVPTVLASVFAAFLPARPRFIIWCQDLVLPAAEGLVAGGQAASLGLRVGRRLEGIAARRAEKIIVCSPGFIDHYVELGVDRERIHVLYNWADIGRIPFVPAVRDSSRKVRFLYGGNIGYSQGLETLVRAARQFDGCTVRIVGAGNEEQAIRDAAKDASNVSIEGPVSRDEMATLLAWADVQVVIQRGVAAGVNLPSKIATCLASGRAIVASIGEDTPAASLLHKSGGAVVVPPDSPTALLEAMRVLALQPELRERLGTRGRQFAIRNLDRPRAVALFLTLLGLELDEQLRDVAVSPA